MGTYEELIAQADEERTAGQFKEASIDYGRALTLGGPRDQYCRHMRGACARRVGEQRLDKAEEHSAQRQSFLDQAARWLTKAEANLDSALEEAPDEVRAEILLEQATTEEALARFLVMCGADPERRLAEARRHREESSALTGGVPR